MEMIKKYLEEKANSRILYIENECFIEYEEVTKASIWIHKLWIEPEYRGKGKINKLEQMLLQEEPHVKTLYANVDIRTGNPEKALLSFLNKGWEILEIDNKYSILIKKDLF